MSARTVRKVENVRQAKKAVTVPIDSLRALDEDAALVAGLTGAVQEQIDEYTSLLEDVVEKATGRSLWAPCDLADAGGDYQTLNRKSGAISYLLVTIGEKADAIQSAAWKLRDPAPPIVEPSKEGTA